MRQQHWVLAGLFFTTLAVLSLEILDTRLLSVSTWYHLSFFAVSIAMFGMSAGAIHVYLGGERFRSEDAARSLARYGIIFAVAIPASHVLNLVIPITFDRSLTALAAGLISILVLSVPFYLAGVLVTIVLTRIPGRIGLTYAIDMVGASLGCLLVIPLLHWANISSAALAIGGFAGIAADCFQRFAGTGRRVSTIAFVIALSALAVLNSLSNHGLRVVFSKGDFRSTSKIQFEAWNTYSQVVAMRTDHGRPQYWGAGEGSEKFLATTIPMEIDGMAGTVMTQWDGSRSELDWVSYDVTSLPYHLRKGGDAAVIGVGGGRDLLTALWAHSRSVTGVEMNAAFLYLLQGPLGVFSRIADQPEVRLVHDEARSYLTRSPDRYDVLQMSLVDTWAATGAGAYTLSENGLYTVDGWKVFLDSLKPGGIFSVSRWFSPEKISETSRLVSLATAALLNRGISNVADHLALVSRDRVATLLLGTAPFTAGDLEILETAASTYGFSFVLAPGHPPADELLARIVASRSQRELDALASTGPYDYSPPTDERPYFFNMLRPLGFLQLSMERSPGVVAPGNLLATGTLLLLGLTTLVLVVVVILGPLWRAGLPGMDRLAFVHAVLYFSLIGVGFMMVQIPYMQRFSVYLGHPTYAIAIILFSMILFTGIGSWLSERIPVETNPGWLYAFPLGIGVVLLSVVLSLQTVIDTTIRMALVPRCLVVVGMTAPVAVLLGLCFPIGIRLVNRISDETTPWMWGVNGACGVLSSVLAVAVSIWAGIHTSLYVALACYTFLLFPARSLWRRGH